MRLQFDRNNRGKGTRNNKNGDRQSCRRCRRLGSLECLLDLRKTPNNRLIPVLDDIILIRMCGSLERCTQLVNTQPPTRALPGEYKIK